ncbi:MAG: histidine kinase dimerization/phospho-acceptor domain-containing protein [Candidatus Dormibacteria bacterium]
MPNGAAEPADRTPLLETDLAGLAHELRTPLTAIMGFADLLEATEDRDTILEYVRIIRSNANVLNDMVAALLKKQRP